MGATGGGDRGEQRFRAGGGRGDHGVWAWVWRRIGDGGGCVGGGAGDVVGMQRVQPDARMVWAGRGLTRRCIALPGKRVRSIEALRGGSARLKKRTENECSGVERDVGRCRIPARRGK